MLISAKSSSLEKSKRLESILWLKNSGLELILRAWCWGLNISETCF